MNFSNSLYRITPVSPDPFTDTLDSRLKLLEMERKMLNSDIDELRSNFARTNDSDFYSKGNSHTLIQRVLQKQREVELNRAEENTVRADLEHKGEFELKYYVENIRDLSKANEYLEDQLAGQHKSAELIRAEKRLLEAELEKQERMKETVLRERLLVQEASLLSNEKAKEVAEAIHRTGSDVELVRGAVTRLGLERDDLTREIIALEQQLNGKKTRLGAVLSDFEAKERQVIGLSLDAQRLLDDKRTNDVNLRLYEEKLGKLSAEKEVLELGVGRIRDEAGEKDARLAKLLEEMRANENMLGDFRELKSRYVEKFDKMTAKRSNALDCVLSDKTKILNIERQTNANIEKAKNLFF